MPTSKENRTSIGVVHAGVPFHHFIEHIHRGGVLHLNAVDEIAQDRDQRRVIVESMCGLGNARSGDDKGTRAAQHLAT